MCAHTPAHVCLSLCVSVSVGARESSLIMPVVSAAVDKTETELALSATLVILYSHLAASYVTAERIYREFAYFRCSTYGASISMQRSSLTA